MFHSIPRRVPLATCRGAGHEANLLAVANAQGFGVRDSTSGIQVNGGICTVPQKGVNTIARCRPDSVSDLLSVPDGIGSCCVNAGRGIQVDAVFGTVPEEGVINTLRRGPIGGANLLAAADTVRSDPV